MNKKQLQLIADKMHKIAFPGEYGNGHEQGSYASDNKMAWVVMGRLIEQLYQEIK